MVLLVSVVPAADAQIIRFAPNGGELGVESHGVRSDSDRLAASWESYVRTWMNLPVSGTLLSPRFLTYSAAVRPTRIQQSMPGGDGQFELRTLGLSLGANLLAAAPVSLSIHTDRTNAQSPREAFGAVTESRNGSSGGLLIMRLPAFPLRMEWSARDQADASRAALGQTPIRRDESLDVLRLTGESSKLTLVGERQRFVDRIGTLDFTSSAATAVHALRWGEGSSLTTSLEAHRRDGREAQVRRLLGEHLHLRHSRRVASDLRVHRQRSRTGNEYRSDVSTTSLVVQADPSPGFSGVAAGSFTSTRLSNGRIRVASAAPSVTLRRKLTETVQLVAQLGVSYQRTNQSLDGAQIMPVTDESHFVDRTRQFVLRNERIDVMTIVVFNRDRTTIYGEGTDYRVRLLGALVRIEVPIVSRIQEGDELVLSYVYRTLAVRAHDLQGLDAIFSLNRSGFSFSHSAVLRRARVIAGDPNAGLEGGDDYVTGLDGRRALFGGQINLNAQHRMRRNAQSEFTAAELRAGFQPRATRTQQSQAGASLSRTSAGAQVATVLGANLSSLWQLRPTLQLVTAAESQRWQLSDGATDRTHVVSINLSWRSGRLESEWRYDWQQRSTLEQRSQHRVSARVLRRF